MKFAIVESGGKQYRAVEGGTLEVDRLPAQAGASLKLDQVLLLADGESVTVGKPFVKDSPIWTTVLEHFKGEKVTIFNYSPKKRIRVKTGHRQNYTRLLVEQIGGSEFVKKEPAEKVVKEEAAPKAIPSPKGKPAKTEPKAAETKAAAPKAAPAKTEKKPAPTSSPKGKAPAKSAEKKPAAPKAKPAASKTETKKTTPKAAPTSSPKGKKPAAKK